MGSVEIASLQKTGFQRLYALKRLRRDLLTDERARAMLMEEGRVAGLVQHPNVVPVLDVGSDERGPYLVMELVAGVQLSELLKNASDKGELLELQLVLRIMVDIARGLHAAHELLDTDGTLLNLVHRDVTPQNVLLGFDGISRVTDFGIVKVLDRESQTTTGVLKGKAGYMSPEQLRFEELDRRSDLFSLGVVFFELLSGRRLYREESMSAAARRILTEPPPDPLDYRSDLPPPVVELLFELLAKDRDARPATAREIEVRLSEVLAELTLADGVIDIGTYLRETFPARLAETLEWRTLAENTSAANDLVPAEATNPHPRKRNRTGLLVVAALLAAAAAAVFAWKGTSGSGVATSPAVTIPAMPTPTATAPMPPTQGTTAPSDTAPVVQAASRATESGVADTPARRTAVPPSKRRGVRHESSGSRQGSGDEELWRW